MATVGNFVTVKATENRKIPGNVTAAVGAIGILRRLLTMTRYCFPGARIRVRLDAGVELHNGFNHHLSKHCSDPFRAVRPIRVVLKAKTPPMTHT
jgi:hypothetical protein